MDGALKWIQGVPTSKAPFKTELSSRNGQGGRFNYDWM
jgi:hypothetical protein